MSKRSDPRPPKESRQFRRAPSRKHGSARRCRPGASPDRRRRLFGGLLNAAGRFVIDDAIGGPATIDSLALLFGAEALVRNAESLAELVGPDALRRRLDPTAVRDGRVGHGLRFSVETTIYAGTRRIQRNIIAQVPAIFRGSDAFSLSRRMADYETLSVTKDDGVAWVSLNRSAVRNAINQQMQSELHDVWRAKDRPSCMTQYDLAAARNALADIHAVGTRLQNGGLREMNARSSNADRPTPALPAYSPDRMVGSESRLGRA